MIASVECESIDAIEPNAEILLAVDSVMHWPAGITPLIR